MLLVVLFAVGFVVAFVLALLLRTSRARVVFAAAGLLAFAAYALYIAAFATCPRVGECDKWLGVLFLAFVAVGWVVGTGAAWLVRRRS